MRRGGGAADDLVTSSPYSSAVGVIVQHQKKSRDLINGMAQEREKEREKEREGERETGLRYADDVMHHAYIDISALLFSMARISING